MGNIINKSRRVDSSVLALFIVSILLGGYQSAIAEDNLDNSHQRTEPIILDGLGCNSRIRLMPEKPNLGDKVKITFYLETPYKNISEFRIQFKLLKGAKVISGETVKVHSSLKKGESAEFSIIVKVVSRLLQVSVWAHAHIKDRFSGDEWGFPIGGGDIDIVTLAKNDTISYEKFGNDPELWPRIGPEYQYDIVEGTIIPPLGRVSKEVQKIREEIEELKKLDTTLTDWDALEMLHDAVYEMIVRYGIHKKEESIPILIKARKFMREQGLSKWEAVDKVIEEIKQEKKKLNFFRHGRGSDTNSGSASDSTPTRQIDITVTGTIKYKKHLIDKDTGLDTVTVDMPLRFGKVYIRGYWLGQGAQYFGPCLTDNNGQFTYTIGGVTPPGYFMPLVFLRGPSIPSGPSGFNRVKVISDTIKFTFIPSPEDSVTWRYRWKVDTLYSSTNIGTRYCAEHLLDGGLWSTNHQPRSGAANIYDWLLKGYEYIVNNGYAPSDTVYKVVARWQPGYKHFTQIKILFGLEPDTIWICGDTTGWSTSWTDEWDDWMSLHEYGHHVMYRCAPIIPPCTTTTHWWDKEYSNDRKLSYTEGWGHLFASVVTNNTYQIDSKKCIGAINDTTYFQNIENPWDYLFAYPPWSDTFMGGPWCEGAVAGVLWDIYDSYDEIPYPSYPWPGFPDTALADTFSMGFAPIWDVFDHYDSAGEPTNCWTIFHFRSGWNAFNYDHQFVLNEILLHHRIRDSIPAAPAGLKLFFENNGVRLYWKKNSEPDLQGYRVYRKESSTVLQWSPWSMIGEPTDTTYLDTTVQFGYTYEYKLTSFDSLGNESNFSDSSRVTLPCVSNSPLATAYNNAPRIVHNPLTGEIFLTYSTNEDIRCVSSLDDGFTWEGMVIATGKFPTLVLDTTDNPCGIFSRWVVQAGGDIGSAQLYYIKFINNHWTTPYLLFKIDSIMGPPELKTPAPSAGIDSKDTIHMIWLTGLSKEYPHWFGVYYGNFYAGDTMPLFDYLAIDTLSVYESPCPSLTVDNQNVVHIAYENGIGAPRLRYRYRENGHWSEKPKPDTLTPDGAYYPNIEWFGDRIHLVWDNRYPDTTFVHSISCRSKTILGWDSIQTIYKPLPFARFGEPVNAGGWYTIWGNQDIYYSRFNGATWGIPETVKVTPEYSAHPTALFHQDLNDTCLYIAWTEGDSAPYRVEFEKITVPAVPKYYADLGQPVQSPCCLNRDGYWIFGTEPYQTTDWGYENLRYKFTGLDPGKEYRMDLAYYFENRAVDDAKSQIPNPKSQANSNDLIINNNGTEVPTPESEKGIGRIVQGLVVDGMALDTAFITPNKLVRISVWLKKESYADGEIVSEIQKIKGKRVVCCEIGLIEFPQEKKEKTISGTMGKESAINQPFAWERIYPNPAKNILRIRFNVPDNNRKITLKLYDASGRLVQKEDFLCAKIGANEVFFAPKGLSNGIYFVRLETDNYQKIEKVIYLK